MSTGEVPAAARRQAGLTITQVSQRTCIRETIIRGIEEDDFAACGGDFYARGHIRAIARAAGVDGEPLVRQHDSSHRTPKASTAAGVPGPCPRLRQRHGRAVAATAVAHTQPRTGPGMPGCHGVLITQVPARSPCQASEPFTIRKRWCGDPRSGQRRRRPKRAPSGLPGKRPGTPARGSAEYQETDACAPDQAAVGAPLMARPITQRGAANPSIGSRSPNGSAAIQASAMRRPSCRSSCYVPE